MGMNKTLVFKAELLVLHCLQPEMHHKILFNCPNTIQLPTFGEKAL